jgi:hypothetical protein
MPREDPFVNKPGRAEKLYRLGTLVSGCIEIETRGWVWPHTRMVLLGLTALLSLWVGNGGWSL